jgi:FMN phosphatase YigB (HAD superfamily)
MTTAAVDVVLFDLGGVLVDFGGVERMRELSGIESDDEVWRRWLTCRWVRSFERGDCSAEEFAAGVVSDWDLPITPDEFLHGFCNWIGGPLAGSDELVSAVQSIVPVGCLSNTNALHWERHFSQWSLLHAFDHCFLSFELGMLKPDREVFDRVAEILAVPPSRILFLDDNELNVDGATAAGYQARHVRGVTEAERALRNVGVLGSSTAAGG